MNRPPHPHPMQVHTCQADGACCRPPRFQAHLDAADGTGPVHKSAEACSDHLGDMVQALTDWARGHRLSRAELRLFAIDRPGESSTSLPAPGGHRGPDTLSLAVSTIRLTE
jgi:hypothetical protein